MSQQTRRWRYERTASALRHILTYGSVPNYSESYFDGYPALSLHFDKYGTWVKLLRTDKMLAILENNVVRVRKDTVYRPYFENYARRHGKRLYYVDRLEVKFPQALSRCRFVQDTGVQYATDSRGVQ